MNQSSMRKKSLYDYQVVIFDLDGTLYFQRPFRLRMIGFLAGYILTHPRCAKDFLIIKKYRKVREAWEVHEKECEGNPKYSALGLEDRQYQYVADQMHTKRARVQNVISFFMLEMPLRFLSAYRDEVLAHAIDTLHRQHKTVVVYSDYPVENKCAWHPRGLLLYFGRGAHRRHEARPQRNRCDSRGHRLRGGGCADGRRPL